MEEEIITLNDGSLTSVGFVYTITTITSLSSKRDSRTVGFYRSLEDADECLKNDWGSLDEAGYYRYAIIERVMEGLYNLHNSDKKREWWHKRDCKFNAWYPIEKPNKVKHICNWSIG